MTKTYFDVYAIQLTEENIPQIIAVTKPLGWNLDSYIQDNMEFNAEDGFDTILFMKLYREDPTQIATFADEEMDDPNPPYRLTDEKDPKFGIFYKVENL
jgi:hypothetical protein